MEPTIKSEMMTVNVRNGNLSVRHNMTKIISGPSIVKFTCAHCGTVFETTNWSRTKGRHYSASCPCCPYQAWAR